MKYEIMSVLCELTNVQQFSKNLNSGKNKSNIKLRFSDELGVPNHENIFWIDKKDLLLAFFKISRPIKHNRPSILYELKNRPIFLAFPGIWIVYDQGVRVVLEKYGEVTEHRTWNWQQRYER